MTATAHTRTSADVRRRGHVYGYLTLAHDPAAARLVGSRTEFGYGGQSRQRHGRRDAQHRDCQPWEDLIVGRPVILADGWWTNGELDEVERAVIAGEWSEVRRLVEAEAARRGVVADLSGVAVCEAAGRRPRYNIDMNLDNPDRVPPWVAREQRWARDDAAGRPRWVPAEERRPVAVTPPAPESWVARLARRAGVVVRRRVRRAWAKVWPWLAGWFAVAVSALVVQLWWTSVGVVDAVWAASAVGVLACGLVARGRKRRGRRRR